MNLDEPSLCNCIRQPLNPVCLLNIHGEEMPGDVGNMGAGEDIDEIEEIRQLTQLLDVEDPNDLSSDEESDRDDDSKLKKRHCTLRSLL